MQNLMQVSSVVDKIRSNSGAALKSVQRTVEETALKAAGLGDDEEALYMLNKQAQAYMRSVEAQQQAAIKLAESFVAALEDIAFRETVRKYGEETKSSGAQHAETLAKHLVDPVKKAYEANSAGVRQKLLRHAFGGLVDCSFQFTGSASRSLQNIVQAVTSMTGEQASSPNDGIGDNMLRKPSPVVAGGYNAPSPPPRQRAATTSMQHAAATPPQKTSKSGSTTCDDLIGGMLDSKPNDNAHPKPMVSSGSADLLDLSSGDLGASTPAKQPFGTSQPLDQQRTPDVSIGFGGLPLDFDFSAAAPAAAPPPSTSFGKNDLGSLGSLGDMSWPAADEEDESCVRARVDVWRQGKNIRTMLMSLHEIAPSNSGWKPIQWADIDADADIKDVYKKAVLRVHPDKVHGSSSKKLLAHLVFESLCEQWKVFRAS